MKSNNIMIKRLKEIGFWLIISCIILFSLTLVVSIISPIFFDKSQFAMFNGHLFIMHMLSILIATEFLISRILVGLSLIGASQIILLWLNKKKRIN